MKLAEDFLAHDTHYRSHSLHGAAASGAGGSPVVVTPEASSKAQAAPVGGGKRPRDPAAQPAASLPSSSRAARFLDPPCTWQAYFDGGSRGNPGIAGAGACVIVNGAEIASAVQGCRHSSTSNEAECTGAALALRLLFALLEAVLCGRVDLPRPSRITVFGDSTLIVNQVQGIWAVRAENLMGPLKELRHLAEQLHLASRDPLAGATSAVGSGLHWQHVKRDLNQRADHLSNLAMDGAKVAYEPPFAPVDMFQAGACPHLRGIVGNKCASVVWTTTAAAAQRFLEAGVVHSRQAAGPSAAAPSDVAQVASPPAAKQSGSDRSDSECEYQETADDILYDIYPDVSATRAA